MLNTSNQFKNELYNDNRDYLCYADITLADGTVLNLEDANIWTDSFSIEDAVSGTSSFDIGATIINKLTLSINNIYEEYSEYDFTDAVVLPYVGLGLPDGTIEKVRKGVFTVDEASYDGSLITLSCLDNMYKLDYVYGESNLSYPATLGEIVRDICYVCGVTLLTTTFFNSSYVVQNRPDDQALTCRQVLSWAAQIACSWARFDVYGRLCLDWYDLSVFEKNRGLNGGIFDEGNPYKTGDSASGGTFNPWTAGDDFNGGTFKDLSRYHHIYSLSAMQICTDDVVITGLKVTESFEETDTEKVQSFLFGTEGYVIALEGNDLIQKGMAETVARSVGGRVVGMRFRPFDVSALNDPSMEAGDPVIVTDRKQRSYQSYITSTTFKAGNYQQVQCSAETPSRNSAQRFSEATRNIVKARREASRKISDYDKAVQVMNQLAANTFGFYSTNVPQADGSIIAYRHDRPTLTESKTVYKSGIDGFWVTQDFQGSDAATAAAGKWKAGFDSSGNAVLNVLSVIGINFDWAHGGTLTLGGQNNVSGKMRILDASGKQIGSWEGSEGLVATKGKFSGSLEAATGTFKGNLSAAGGSFTGSISVGNLFSVDTVGNVTANSLKSSNAQITGGTINIVSGDTDTSSGGQPMIKLQSSFWHRHLDLLPHYMFLEETTSLDRCTYSNGGVLVYESDVGYSYYNSGLAETDYVTARKSLTSKGEKSRAVETENHGTILQYCYEMSSPVFGDIGSGRTDEDGQCYVYFDAVFMETVSSDRSYQVFLQKEGPGDLWIEEKNEEYFLVKGTPGLLFSWEVKVKQKDYEYKRLDVFEDPKRREKEIDYENGAVAYLKEYEEGILNYEENN